MGCSRGDEITLTNGTWALMNGILDAVFYETRFRKEDKCRILNVTNFLLIEN